MSHPTESEKIETLYKIISGTRDAFFVTQTPGGPLHGRPMATAKVEKDLRELWFPTARNSGKVSELSAEAHVCLGYNNASGSDWAAVTGRATIVDDRAKVKELWSPFWKTWFDGPDDPNLVLIKVTPESAEYWDSAARTIVMAKMLVSAVTGQKLDVGENEKVNLK